MRHAHGRVDPFPAVLEAPVRAAVIGGEKRVTLVETLFNNDENLEPVFKLFGVDLLADKS
jgi:hypothetical protein